jgi:hypothetical protein
VTYLVLRRRKIRWFNGVDLRSEEGWTALNEATRRMAEALEPNRQAN